MRDDLMGSLFADPTRPTDAMIERIEALQRSSSPNDRWKPHRVIAVNWWLWPRQEFCFAGGWLFVRGPNANGKSLLLSSIVPFILDADARPYRLDPAGTATKYLSFFILGPQNAKTGSSFYHSARISYIALEFRHTGTGEYRTIVQGFYGRRTDANPEIDRWGFVLRDGRRIGYDLLLTDETGAPLTQDECKAAVGANPFTTDGPGYQKAVNDALFGFPNLETFRLAMDVTLPIRMPNLHGKLTPELLCDKLSESLPPLDQGVLEGAAATLERIDETEREKKETEVALKHVAQVHEEQGLVAFHAAQLQAVRYQEAETAATDAGDERDVLAAQRSEKEAEAAEAKARSEALLSEAGRADARLHVLRQSEAFASRDQIGTAETALADAEGIAARTNVDIEARLGDVTRADERKRRIEKTWRRDIDLLGDSVQRLAEHGTAAAWPLVQDAAAMGEAYLAALTSPTVDDPGGFPPRELPALASERGRALTEAVKVRETVDKAQRVADDARARVDEVRAQHAAADQARQETNDKLDEARVAAVAGVTAWAEPHRKTVVSAANLESVADALHAYADPAEAAADAVRPIEEAMSVAIHEAETQCRSAERALANVRDELEDAERDLAAAKGEAWGTPPLSPEQTAARAALATAGVQAVPLYAAIDLREGASEADAARVEAALEAAGLLGALVVPADDAARARDVIAETLAAGGSERWLLTAKAATHTTGPLTTLFAPANCGLDAAEVRAVLGTLGDDPETGTRFSVGGDWKIGPLAGFEGATSEGVRYIGETARRLRRERRIAELTALVARLEVEVASAEAHVDALEQKAAGLRRDLRQLPLLPELRALTATAHRLVLASEEVRRIAQKLAQADEASEKARIALAEAKGRYEQALVAAPDARGRTPAEVRDLITATRQVQDLLYNIGRDVERLGTLRREHADAVTSIERAAARHDEAVDGAVAARARVEAAQATLDALKERARGMGLDHVLGEMAAIESRLKDISKERERLLRTETEAMAEARHKAGLAATAEAAYERASCERDAAERAMIEAFQAYPTERLAPARESWASDPNPFTLAERLLVQRRTADGAKLMENVQRDLNEAANRLVRVFGDTLPYLSAQYSPELVQEGTPLVRFKFAGSRVLPAALVQRLTQEREDQSRILAEHERQLYEEFILNNVVTAIRDRIQDAKDLCRAMNDMFANKRFTKGRLSLKVAWEPKPSDKSDLNYKIVVDLLKQELTLMTDPRIEMIKRFFRAQIAKIRESEKQRKLEKTYTDALREILDYREWFRFSILWSKEPGEPLHEMTSRNYGTGSGAQKTLAIFCPLAAAAHVRLMAARPDAPRLIGMDEAFNGIDGANMEETIKFLVDMDYDVVATSEDEWGISSHLRACANYELGLVGNVPTAQLWLWNGRRNEADGVEPVAEIPTAAREPEYAQ